MWFGKFTAIDGKGEKYYILTVNNLPPGSPPPALGDYETSGTDQSPQ